MENGWIIEHDPIYTLTNTGLFRHRALFSGAVDLTYRSLDKEAVGVIEEAWHRATFDLRRWIIESEEEEFQELDSSLTLLLDLDKQIYTLWNAKELTHLEIPELAAKTLSSINCSGISPFICRRSGVILLRLRGPSGWGSSYYTMLRSLGLSLN